MYKTVLENFFFPNELRNVHYLLKLGLSPLEFLVVCSRITPDRTRGSIYDAGIKHGSGAYKIRNLLAVLSLWPEIRILKRSLHSHAHSNTIHSTQVWKQPKYTTGHKECIIQWNII